jgi:coenzyme F420-reducing hydrogenase alpha subunit
MSAQSRKSSPRSARGKARTIRVKELARVEGEGGLLIRLKGDRVSSVKLDIFEPPRFFEAFLRGRQFTEAPDITARICGICPVAYQMSSCHAMESVCGVSVGGALRELRRLLYCGEWIESHALHVYLLHAPDFLGYESAVHLARDDASVVERGLQLKKLGNDILDLLGGRSVHPVNVRVGGFFSVPRREQLLAFTERLERAREAALETVRWVAGFEFPDLEYDYEFVALRHPTEYPLNEGRIVSSRGLDIDITEYEEHFEERQESHSTALHSRIKERGDYLVGPLARYNLNRGLLSPLAREAAREAGLGEICRNPFQSIIVRSVEILYACEEALRIVAAYEPPDAPAVPVTPRAGQGHGCTEAPRGTLYHRYEIDEKGRIVEARIVPPTSQNQPTIENDLRRFVEGHTSLPDDRLTWRCEQVVRNYDPCISCATHFLKLAVERE